MRFHGNLGPLTVLLAAGWLVVSLAFAAPSKDYSKAYMTSPTGEEITLVRPPAGKSLSARQIEFEGVYKPIMGGSCTGKNSQKLRLGLTEYKLELRMLMEELRQQKRPRRISKVQENLIAEIPACEDFQWELAVISKLLKNYNLDRIE